MKFDLHTDLSRRRLLGAGLSLSGLALAGCASGPKAAVLVPFAARVAGARRIG